MERVKFDVASTSGLIRDVVGYLPFDGAEFVAHRAIGPMLEGTPAPPSGWWHVTHLRTSLLIPYTGSAARKKALALADKLSRECPSAHLVFGPPDAPKGPYKRLVSEAKAALGLAA